MNCIFRKIIITFFFIGVVVAQQNETSLKLSKNVLDYKGNPKEAKDRTSLVFSDKGAWFGFGFLDNESVKGGFSGPYLLTEQNGVWLSNSFVALQLLDEKGNKLIDWKENRVAQNSFLSHLEQTFKNDKVNVKQELFFSSGHSALLQITITNSSLEKIKLSPVFQGTSFLDEMSFTQEKETLKIVSKKSNAVGYIQFFNANSISTTNNDYKAQIKEIELQPKETKEIKVAISFIFPQYSWEEEKKKVTASSFMADLEQTKLEKKALLEKVLVNKKVIYSDVIYSKLVSKTLLTLQNNTRIAAEGLQHEGLFPSYHYEWFNGFWAWDSWKHAVALARYDSALAKNQVRAMFDYQEENGFIPDCIYRDTLIEPNNYRNTKSPLAAWAVWEIYKQDKDRHFLKEMYPKLKKYHNWWYSNRDHDKDGICEFGSTDGTLIAAKWESGMDNAVRFDESLLLKNNETAFSLNQESVDLNSFLYVEKNELSKIALLLDLETEAKQWKAESVALKAKIQQQFWDSSSGWFFDTSLDGKNKIKVMGCEGYLPLWAKVASKEQAESIQLNMLNESIFNTYVPLPTLAVNEPKFAPDNGYWRGPIWLDQSYFGIKGLENYGYIDEANSLARKLIHNAEGVLKEGEAIRENYQPLSGKGLEAYNFSWSAAHYFLLLLKE
ncbi:MGH1-like glycoside hydrolase domain-containing protein [Flavobacterium sp.]|uniref:MGH1-like glycoside hydrolase domain-containing protein n=1 Tax=Flavobacterium sp. TaxID=239 RepID=UPI004047831D